MGTKINTLFLLLAFASISLGFSQSAKTVNGTTDNTLSKFHTESASRYGQEALNILHADEPVHRTCGTAELHAERMATDAEYNRRHTAYRERLKALQDAGETLAPRTAEPLVTIPVVVHVLYRLGAQNISDAQIQSQIDVLNEDYRRMNADTTSTPVAFQPVATDVNIEFCLASIDPDGNPTTGIERREVSTSNIGSSSNYYLTGSGGLNAWNASQYLNIWVCEINGGILGFAQPPGSPATFDGIVIQHRYFGRTGFVSSPFNRGRTATHEVGHWLGLRHIWGDGGCSVDDGVLDTPVSDAANYSCPTTHSSCSSLDMVQNYMDYTDDFCMNIFTAGQAFVMQNTVVLERAGLLSSDGCNGSSCIGEDTLNYPLVGTPALYLSDNPGYLAGHNDYGDQAKAQYITDYAPFVRLDGVHIEFGAASAGSATSSVMVKVWDGAGGTPGAQLKFKELLISDIIAAGGIVDVNFFNPITIPGPFFIGVEYSYADDNDTVAILTNTIGDVTSNTAWEMWDDGTWHAFDESTSWGISVDLSISPIVNDGPLITVTPSSGDIASGGSVVLTALGGTGYTWTPATGLSDPNSPFVVASPTETTVYTVMGVGANGCSASANVVVTVDGIAGIKDEFQTGEISLYPNPSNGIYTLDLNFSDRKNLQLTVSNALGQTVKRDELVDILGSYHTSLDLTGMSDGVYFLNLTDGNLRYTRKLVKK